MTRFVNCENCGNPVRVPGKENDNRMANFTVRLRAYDLQSANRCDDPVYDSADGYPPDHLGIDVITGIRNILTECIHELNVFHGEALHGLTPDYLDKKERGIRPTLSRTGGRGRITLDYNTLESFTDGRQPARYKARIDINRLNQPKETGQ